MSDEFKEGDIVILKSGGPEMTIENFSAGDSSLEELLEKLDRDDSGEEKEQEEIKAICVWFDKNIRREANFSLHTLVKISEPKE